MYNVIHIILVMDILVQQQYQVQEQMQAIMEYLSMMLYGFTAICNERTKYHNMAYTTIININHTSIQSIMTETVQIEQ